MPFLNTDASRMHYEAEGSGPAIVLLHGFPENGSLWQNILPQLTSYRVIVPDLPGAVGSTLERETSIDDMAGLVYDVLTQEGITRAVVAGHSMGGYVALSMARQFPQALAGLCLVHSSPFPDDEEKKANRLRVINLIERGAKEAFLDQMVPSLFAESFRTNHSSIIEQQIQRSYLMPANSIVNFYKAMMNRQSSTEILAALPFPIQWILGEEDSLIPVAKILPFTHHSATNFVSLYKGCGHMSMLEMPARLVADLNHFLEFCYQ
ncbi:MAG: alpha/beta hydrolase [Chitinophagia bacterium]|nr:alpha/beta hydrolase [Chitinophagia bacterium]